MELTNMVCATGNGMNKSKKCLEGTRAGVLNEVVDWINTRDPNTPHVFWPSGQAGKGKSAIAHTVAAWAKDLGVLGSCFCFARDRRAERCHEKMFTTIARDLADCDPLLRHALANALSRDFSLKSTVDIEAQWCKLIVEPLLKVAEDVVGNFIVVIDALDESGHDVTREDILRILSSTNLCHLPNLRIFLTSRPVHDIRNALDDVTHVKAMSLDDVDAATTEQDICLYIKNRLRVIRTTFSGTEAIQLFTMSDGLFEWARLACEFIKPRKAGVNARKRFNELISRTQGQGLALLDEMYYITLSEIVHDSEDARTQFQSVMRQILCIMEPLPIESLNAMHQHFQGDQEPTNVREILEFMGALLSGITDKMTPVRPLHASFYDFLTDPSRGGDFYMVKVELHLDLAHVSIQVMQ